MVREFGTNRYTLVYLKQVTKSYCTARGTLFNVMWQPGWEESLRENDTCVCMAESLHSHLKLSQPC